MTKIYETLDPENVERVRSIVKLSKEAHGLMKKKMAELEEMNNQLCDTVAFLFEEDDDSDPNSNN